jgi:NAD(P)H-flavin reductase
MDVDQKSLYLPRPARLIEVETLAKDGKLFRVQLEADGQLDHSPGQFVEVSISGDCETSCGPQRLVASLMGRCWDSHEKSSW